ncbi:jg2716 [Pararge aegeria aegeria]|uniref:Jg2716 protein n=1 Tax=Pararge aegeria aegeria TaxID=348720 RepID=A0A8S4QUC0_9NEOP|nr:jg2716 [Pararge aegeria aegeria]
MNTAPSKVYVINSAYTTYEPNATAYNDNDDHCLTENENEPMTTANENESDAARQDNEQNDYVNEDKRNNDKNRKGNNVLETSEC